MTFKRLIILILSAFCIGAIIAFLPAPVHIKMALAVISGAIIGISAGYLADRPEKTGGKKCTLVAMQSPNNHWSIVSKQQMEKKWVEKNIAASITVQIATTEDQIEYYRKEFHTALSEARRQCDIALGLSMKIVELEKELCQMKK